MIVFNHNIRFPGLPQLEDHRFNPALETITVVQGNQDLANSHKINTEWIAMSGREARYTAERDFADCRSGCGWGLEIKDIVSFTWRNGESQIEYRPHKGFSPELLQFWLFHTLLPIMLTLQNRYEILHVGSIEISGHPIIFSAESFGGKSTLTDYFLHQGHPFLSDDTLGIYRQDEEFIAVASYPFQRPYRTPEHLGYPVANVSTPPKPLHAVYVLEKSAADAPVVISEITGIEKFKAFHFTSFVNFTFLKQHRFQFLGDMARAIPAYTLTLPWDLKRLPDVYNATVAHVKGH